MDTIIKNNKNRKLYLQIAVILAFAIVEVFLVNSGSDFSTTVALVSLFLGLIWDRKLAIAGFICFSMLNVEMGTMGNLVLLILIGLILGRSLFKLQNKSIRFYFRLTLLFCVFAFISYLYGLELRIVALALFLFHLLFALYVAELVCNRDGAIIIISLIAVGVSMVLFVWTNPQVGNVLRYQENSKDLSTALAFPVYMMAWALINGKVKGFFKMVLALIFLALFIITILYTYSRGVLLALLASVFYLLITANNKHRFAVLLSFIAVIVFVSYLQMVQIDYDKMFGHLEGGNGRTDIWLNFYNTMKSQGNMRIMFGCGPNSLQNLTRAGTYAHSAILDYFFSYGIIGFSYILVVIVRTFVSLIKTKNKFFIGLMLLTMFMFIPHGTCDDLLFLSMLGMCIGGSCIPSKSFSIEEIK